jgi:bicarbonate transport system substrate-binding protein
MTNFSNYSRRKFLFTAGASAASSILLKGCLGNPPSATVNSATAQQTPVAAVDPAQAPETTRITLGYIPIVESAPIVIAQQKGFFAKYGMTEVTVSKQANWASARDNVVIGAENGGIDGGQWQMPMPHLISEGLITNGQKLPMYILAQIRIFGFVIGSPLVELTQILTLICWQYLRLKRYRECELEQWTLSARATPGPTGLCQMISASWLL